MDVNNLGHIPNMSNRYLIEMAVRELDPLTMWNIVSEKVLSHFKIWDLLIHKVFRYNAHQQITNEGLQHLASEVDLMFKEKIWKVAMLTKPFPCNMDPLSRSSI